MSKGSKEEEKEPDKKKKESRSVRSETRTMLEALWCTVQDRKYYYGVGCDRRYSLDEAAKKVNIPKKTLDGYFA